MMLITILLLFSIVSGEINVDNTITIEPNDKFTLEFNGEAFDGISYSVDVRDPTGVVNVYLMKEADVVDCSSEEVCTAYAEYSFRRVNNATLEREDITLPSKENAFVIGNPNSFERRTVDYRFTAIEKEVWKWWIWAAIIGGGLVYLGCIILCGFICF